MAHMVVMRPMPRTTGTPFSHAADEAGILVVGFHREGYLVVPSLHDKHAVPAAQLFPGFKQGAQNIAHSAHSLFQRRKAHLFPPGQHDHIADRSSGTSVLPGSKTHFYLAYMAAALNPALQNRTQRRGPLPAAHLSRPDDMPRMPETAIPLPVHQKKPMPQGQCRDTEAQSEAHFSMRHTDPARTPNRCFPNSVETGSIISRTWISVPCGFGTSFPSSRRDAAPAMSSARTPSASKGSKPSSAAFPFRHIA